NWSLSGGYVAIDWSPTGAEPAADQQYEVTYYYDCVAPRITGVEKHTVGTAGVRTTSSTESVDGYTAVPQVDVDLAAGGGAFLEGQSRWVLPVVQTNNGWNTAFVITNVSNQTTAVSATFYGAGG